MSAISLMSAPAANAFSEPVITMQPMSSSASKAVDRGDELRHERGIERVERLRPVEPDDADPALRLDDDGLVAHGLSPACLHCFIGLSDCMPARNVRAACRARVGNRNTHYPAPLAGRRLHVS